MNKIRAYIERTSRLDCFLLGVKIGLVIFVLMLLAYTFAEFYDAYVQTHSY